MSSVFYTAEDFIIQGHEWAGVVKTSSVITQGDVYPTVSHSFSCLSLPHIHLHNHYYSGQLKLLLHG